MFSLSLSGPYGICYRTILQLILDLQNSAEWISTQVIMINGSESNTFLLVARSDIK